MTNQAAVEMKVNPGLDGIVAAQTRLSCIDGQAGELIIAGFPVEELASKATFEETVYLLWYDTLPNAAQLADFRQALAARRALPQITQLVLNAAAAQKIPVMDALRMAVSSISSQASRDMHQDALILVACFPTIVATYWRLLNGQEPIAPRADLNHAANYLYMLSGQIPSPERVRGMETYLNTVVDHGLNASTFTARVIISTQSDLISAITGAIGALKGPLHGGAPGPALDMVLEIGEPSRAEPYLRAKLEQDERLMGFGHRVYKVRDPRAEVLSAAAERLFRTDGDTKLYELARHVEQVAVALLAEYKPGRNLQTNVEFYTALLLHGLGLPTDLFTPTFAISRVAGWIAHCFEQQAANRLIRPQSVYIGVKGRRWIPLEAR
ncbi:MAG: citrate synthase/methylcitrate synthase [Anaerolineae bacterium]|nr:citrate synthase/methylcitrate synthase [Anaerolineae bacterium]MDW8098724.1 citrate synthase/methylcitrate synthase [Anaerolineae bacterium]